MGAWDDVVDVEDDDVIIGADDVNDGGAKHGCVVCLALQEWGYYAHDVFDDDADDDHDADDGVAVVDDNDGAMHGGVLYV